MNYYAKQWTMGRGTQWANGGGDVAEYRSYRSQKLRDLAVAEGDDMEPVTAGEARNKSPELMVRVAHADGRNTFELASDYGAVEIGDEYENETIIG
jgi:hypothetical protein